MDNNNDTMTPPVRVDKTFRGVMEIEPNDLMPVAAIESQGLLSERELLMKEPASPSTAKPHTKFDPSEYTYDELAVQGLFRIKFVPEPSRDEKACTSAMVR